MQFYFKKAELKLQPMAQGKLLKFSVAFSLCIPLLQVLCPVHSGCLGLLELQTLSPTLSKTDRFFLDSTSSITVPEIPFRKEHKWFKPHLI
jgi:hypothetical protein